MNIFSFSKSTGECYAAIISNEYDTSKNIEDANFIKSKPGLKISVYGQTNDTRVVFSII